MKKDSKVSEDVRASQDLIRRGSDLADRLIEYANNGIYGPRWLPYVCYPILFALLGVGAAYGCHALFHR